MFRQFIHLRITERLTSIRELQDSTSPSVPTHPQIDLPLLLATHMTLPHAREHIHSFHLIWPASRVLKPPSRARSSTCYPSSSPCSSACRISLTMPSNQLLCSVFGKLDSIDKVVGDFDFSKVSLAP
jgi:hypothetical protein